MHIASVNFSDMKIYTKGGDKGSTSLVGGERVAKNHPRVEAYGNVDELISWLGLVRAMLENESVSCRAEGQAAGKCDAAAVSENDRVPSECRIGDCPAATVGEKMKSGHAADLPSSSGLKETGGSCSAALDGNHEFRVHGDTIRRIQKILMLGSSHLACESGSSKLKPMDEDEIYFLEGEIDRMAYQIPEQKAFVLPAGPELAAVCHVARTVCRRAERSCVPFMNDSADAEITARYLNRLSDYLFTLSRHICFIKNYQEDFWLP